MDKFLSELQLRYTGRMTIRIHVYVPRASESYITKAKVFIVFMDKCCFYLSVLKEDILNNLCSTLRY